MSRRSAKVCTVLVSLLLLGLLTGCETPAAQPQPAATPATPASAMPIPSSAIGPTPTPSERTGPAGQQALMRFYTALAERRFAEAYNMLGPTLRAAWSLEDFTAKYENLSDLGIQKMEVRREGEQEVEIAVRLTLTKNVGGSLIREKSEALCTLRQAQEGWRLDSLQEETLEAQEQPLGSPEEVLAAYYNALQSRQFAQAYTLVSGEFRRTHPLGQFASDYHTMVGIFLEEAKVREVAISEAKVDCRVRWTTVEDRDLVTRLWGITWTLRLEGENWRLHQADGKVMTTSVQSVAWLEIPIMDFYAALDRGDFAAAYALLMEGRRAALPFDEFRAQYAHVQGVRVKGLRAIEVDALQAHMVVEIELDEVQKDGSFAPVTYSVDWWMRRVGDTWRLDASRVQAGSRQEAAP